MKQKEFKEKMPVISAWVDSLVEVFGKEVVHQQIRIALDGGLTFYASENGYVIGERRVSGESVGWDERGIACKK